MPRMRTPASEDAGIHARIGQLARRIAAPAGVDAFEGEAAFLGHAAARRVAGVARDLQAVRPERGAREPRERERELRRDALARGTRADPVADLEARNRPVDGVQAALADERAVGAADHAEIERLAAVPLRLHAAAEGLRTLGGLRLPR